MNIQEIAKAVTEEGADVEEILGSAFDNFKPKDEFDAVYEALRKERNDHKESRAKLARFNGVDPDEIFQKLDRIEELEAAAGGIDASKIDEMVNIRLKQHTGPLERELSLKNAEIEEYRQRIEAEEKAKRERTISDSLRSAASAANVVQSAVDDITMIGRAIFDVDDSGKVIAKDGVGITPGITPEAWLTEARNTKPHWWPQSRGAGATGGSAPVSSDNPWSANGWNLTAQSVYLKEHGREKAEHAAKNAGSFVGALRPPKEK